MSEWITGRNPAFEVLRAKRRQVNRLWLAQGIKPQGHLEDIVNLARSRKIPIEVVKRNNLDGIDPHHQGLALEVGGYPYSDLEAIIQRAKSRYQPSSF